jgi:hypothetical protein
MYSFSFGLLGTLAVVLSTAAAANVSAQSVATERDKVPNLTGAWTLNRDLSDDTAKLLESMQGGDHGGSGGGQRRPGGGGHGPGMHGGGGGGNRSGMTPEQMRAMRARMSEVLDTPARLTIVQGDGSVTLTNADGRSHRLTTNDKKEKRPVADEMVEVRAKWDDGRLVNETWFSDGMNVTETYSIGPDRRQLNVAVKVEGSHVPRSVTLRRVYDAESLR